MTRARFVKSAHRLGFSLDEIADLLKPEDGTHCDEASRLAEHKLRDIQEKLAELGCVRVSCEQGQRVAPVDCLIAARRRTA